MDSQPQPIDIGGEVYHVDQDLTEFLRNGLPAVLTGCGHTRQVIKQEDLFLICGSDGNVCAGCGCGMGLYTNDTRYLNGLQFQLEGQTPTLLSFSAERNYMAHIEYMNPPFTASNGVVVPQETLYLSNTRAIGNALREQVQLVNYNHFEVPVRLSVEFRADFADIFEVRNYHKLNHGTYFHPKVENNQILFSYQGRDNVLRQTRVRFVGVSPRLEILPVENNSSRAIAHIELLIPANGQVAGFEYMIEALQDGKGTEEIETPFDAFLASLVESQEKHLSTQTQLSTSNEIFNLVLKRSTLDLASLTTFHPTGPFLAAGVPWYTSPFGRDAILTAFQTLMLGQDLAVGTLRYLANLQGTADNPYLDEEPGKILHERRFGELANLQEVPQTQYYGSIDSTPLFLILLSETFRWNGDLKLVQELWDSVERALMWIDGYGDIDGDGFVEYQRRSSLGLVNQAWKDSGNSVIFPDATLAEPPIAIAEVQGYVYDAKRRIAQLCYLMDLRILGDRLIGEAAELKAQFNEAFWLEKEGFYALALDGNKRPVNTKTSNPGHCLWSGIIDEKRIPQVINGMMSHDMFNGWGIRTLSSDSPVYNPLSYHNGTVWPHDNSIIAKGMADAGFKDEAVQIMDSLYSAALMFDYYRLPELFCGFGKASDLDKPVPYPVACSPQSWAAGSIFLLLQNALGLIPDAPNHAIHVFQPMLPPWLDVVTLNNLRIGDSTVDLQFLQNNGITTVRVLKKRGLVKVLIEG